MRRQEQLEHVRHLLAVFSTEVGYANAVNYTDINVVAEDLLEVLLKQVCSWDKLENLNRTQQNYPGIDLGDTKARVAVQVTSRADAEKVKETLYKFREYRHFERYDRLVILVVGQKQNRYRSNFDTIIGNTFTFDQEKDILDFSDLVRAIHALTDDALTGVYDYLDGQLSVRVSSRPPPQRIVGNVLHLPAFEGRVDKLAQLEQSIIRDGVRLTQLCGPTGRGKSALATHFINRDRLFASIVFVSLRSQPFLIETVLELLAKTLPHNRSERLDQVRRESQETGKLIEAVLLDCIGEHKTLIVLDNLEDALINDQFKPEYKALSTFVSKVVELDNHACQLLITSQKPLDPTALGDSRGSLPSAHEISLEGGLSETEGIKLLRDLGDEKSGLWTASNERLRQLVNDCEGIPLVLVNLVGQLKRRRSLTLTRLLEKRDLFETLKNEPARALYESLSPDEQKVMQALAIYRKSVPEAALRHLFPELDIEQLLETLEASYAVQFSDGDPISYSLRPLDQSYIYAQIPQEARKRLHHATVSYFLNLDGNGFGEWGNLGDLQPLLSAIEQLIKAENYNLACGLLTGIDHDYLLRWGYSSLVRDLHLQLEGKVTAKPLVALHLNALANAYRRLDEKEKALPCHIRELEVAHSLEDHQMEADALSNLSAVLTELKRYPEASTYAEELLAIAQKHRDSYGIISGLNQLGTISRRMGERGQAFRYYFRGLKLARDGGYRHLERGILHNLGALYNQVRDGQTALEHYRRALAMNREEGDQLNESLCLHDISNAYINLRNRTEADEKRALACLFVAFDLLFNMEHPTGREVFGIVRSGRESLGEAAFERLLVEVFANGDAILQEATGQDYTYYRDIPSDRRYDMLALFNSARQ